MANHFFRFFFKNKDKQGYVILFQDNAIWLSISYEKKLIRQSFSLKKMQLKIMQFSLFAYNVNKTMTL